MIKAVCPALTHVHGVRASQQVGTTQVTLMCPAPPRNTNTLLPQLHLGATRAGDLQLQGDHLLTPSTIPLTRFLGITVNGQHFKLPMVEHLPGF